MEKEQKIHLAIIIFANVFPLLGFLLLGWNPFGVYFIYIIETILITIFTVILFILKILSTRNLYLLFSIFILFGNLLVLAGQVAIPFAFIVIENSDITFQLIKELIFDVRIGIIIMCLSNLYGIIELIYRVGISKIDDIKLSINVFLRNTFGFIVFIIALLISEINFDYFSNKMNLVAAIIVILFHLFFSVGNFIFSLKLPQKTLPS